MSGRELVSASSAASALPTTMGWIPELADEVAEDLGQPLVVLDDEDPHRPSPFDRAPEDRLGRQADAEALLDCGLQAAGEDDDVLRARAVVGDDREGVARREADRPVAQAP